MQSAATAVVRSCTLCIHVFYASHAQRMQDLCRGYVGYLSVKLGSLQKREIVSGDLEAGEKQAVSLQGWVG